MQFGRIRLDGDAIGPRWSISRPRSVWKKQVVMSGAHRGWMSSIEGKLRQNNRSRRQQTGCRSGTNDKYQGTARRLRPAVSSEIMSEENRLSWVHRWFMEGVELGVNGFHGGGRSASLPISAWAGSLEVDFLEVWSHEDCELFGP